MATVHPETEIVPYLRGELSVDERARVSTHLEGCEQCRASAEASSAILSNLARLVEDVREPDWTTYRAELNRKLFEARAIRGGVLGRWWADVQLPILRWPSIAVAAGAVGVLAIAIATHRGAGLPAPGVDQLELQQELSSTDVGLLANYHVVENLDLLENYDVIEHLDELGPGEPRQSNETPS
jgi:anti-sigma factor RsiW